MKYLFLASILLSCFLAEAQKGRRIIPTKQADNGLFITSGINPGDTIILQEKQSPYSYVYYGSQAVGTESLPVVTMLEGKVLLTSGLSFESRFHKVLGGGNLRINSNGAAVSIQAKASDIEISGLDIEKAQFGFWIKNEVSCDTSLNNHIINNVSIHDNRVRNIAIQGMYIGSTNPIDGTRPVACSTAGVYYPSRIGSMKIYNNDFNGSGRPSIQISWATVGQSEIFNNKIRNSGREKSSVQGGGIVAGMLSRVYIHDNYVTNTYGEGIAAYGSSFIRVENNIVDSSGFLDGARVSTYPPAIAIDTRRSPYVDSVTVIVKGNKVGTYGSAAGEAIQIGRQLAYYRRLGNIICENVTLTGAAASVKVAAGIQYIEGCAPETPVPNVPVPASEVMFEIYIDALKQRFQIMKNGTWKLVQ